MKLKYVYIGLEHERVIKDEDGLIRHVKGAKQEEFPHDTMACLAETRGYHCACPKKAVEYFLEEQKRVDKLYERLNFKLHHGEHTINENTASESYERNKLSKEKTEDDPNFNLIRGGGLHIHFSTEPRWITIDPVLVCGHLVPKLDTALEEYITGLSFYRKRSQIRMKKYGFEYRSCFWDGDTEVLKEIAQRAFTAVKETNFQI